MPMVWLLALWLAFSTGAPAAPAKGSPESAPRPRDARRVSALPSGSSFPGDTEAPLTASVYSLPSSFADGATAASLLQAVRALDSGRTLIVLADPPMSRSLREPAARLGVRLLETPSSGYSPWIRDPLSFFWTPAGRLFVLTRPNRQPGREADFDLGRELVERLPADLDRKWGGVRWAEARVPFHNGQILVTPSTVWVSLHSLEPQILSGLGIGRVPVETFGSAPGIDRYTMAAETAASELGKLYGRPVRFVHPLPLPGAPPSEKVALMRRIGGAAGYDLDSYLTLLPGPGAGHALVADLSAGAELLASLPETDLSSLRGGYGLSPASVALREELARPLRSAGAADLQAFLDLAAGHLKAEGFTVGRLPLLIVPVTLLADPEGVGNAEFWLGWNNVVVERRAGKVRAEGFGSLLPAGDTKASEIYARIGCRLDLLPSLPKSVILTGGYRCASNHVRAKR